MTVTTEDFAAVALERPLRDTRNLDCWTLGNLYQAAASEAQEANDDAEVRVYSLLSAIANIHFKPEDRAEPYGPQSVFGGRRSLIPSDLQGEQTAVIAGVVRTIQNPGLRARLADIVWYNERKRAPMAQQAVAAYCTSIELVLDGKAEFFDEDRTASSIDGCNMLHRACQIARATGWKDPEGARLRTLLASVIRDAVDRHDHRGFGNSAEIALQFGIDDPATIAADAEAFAQADDVDPHWSQDLWELAARAHTKLQDQQQRNRCLVGAAESYVTIADAAGGTGMVAASFFMDAIKALRRLPNTKQRRQELEERLHRAQATVRDEMGVISIPFDPTEHVKYARRTVGGVGLAQAIGEFADFASSPDPEELREEARRQAEENLLSSLMPATVVDDDGKVVAQSPAYMAGGADEESALRHSIVRNEGLRRHTDVEGLIEPARQLIQSEHPLHRCDLRVIAELTPFVPADRVDLVTMGLSRFFGGDFFSALHILIPQLENSLRHILKLTGVEPSAIHSDMTQESRTLSVMLDKERESLERTLGPAIVFEIDNLFDFRGGPAVRHQVAHGLVSSAACYNTDAIYACWFIFQLYCLPLFPYWDQLARRLDAPLSNPRSVAVANLHTSAPVTVASASQPPSRRKVWFRRSPSSRLSDDWHWLALTALGVAAARETLLTATLPFAEVWTDLFQNMLAPGEELRWRDSGPGTGRDARVAYSSLLGRYMARAYLMGHEDVRILVPVDTARRAFRHSPYHLAQPPREPGLEADWIGLDDRHLIIAEAKGSFDKGTRTWSGPSSVPKVLRNAIQQSRRTNVFRSPSTTALPAKRWAVASRWGNEENGFEPTLLAWDPEEEPLQESDYHSLAKLLHERDVRDILTGLGHLEVAQLLYSIDTRAPIPGEFPVRVGRQTIDAGFSAALGPIGMVPIREPSDLDWAHRMRDSGMHIALVSMSGRYARTPAGDSRARDKEELPEPIKGIGDDDGRVASQAGLTVAWPSAEDDIEVPGE